MRRKDVSPRSRRKGNLSPRKGTETTAAEEAIHFEAQGEVRLKGNSVVFLPALLQLEGSDDLNARE